MCSIRIGGIWSVFDSNGILFARGTWEEVRKALLANN